MLNIGSERDRTEADDDVRQDEFDTLNPEASAQAASDLVEALSPVALKKSRHLRLVTFNQNSGQTLSQSVPLNSRQVQAAISAYSA